MELPPPNKTLAVPRQAPFPDRSSLPCLQALSGPSAGRLYIVTENLTVGRDPTSSIHLDDPGVSWHHAELVVESGRVTLHDRCSTNGTYIGGETVGSRVLGGGELIHVGPSSLLKFGFLPQAEIELGLRLYESATRDPLTGLLNRGSFLERLQQEVAHGRRHEILFTLVMADVDHFKSINDTEGHPAGDAVLRHLAKQLRSHCRLEDVVGRYGGEEFVLLLRNIGPAGAMEMAERLREHVAQDTFWISDDKEEPGKPLKVTVSFGVAAWEASLSPDALIARADRALYRAKVNGRNRVEATD